MDFYHAEYDEDLLIIRADGDLNASTASEFIQPIEKLVDGGLKKIIVDCEKLDHVSSYGIGVLVQLHSRMKQHGGDVKIAALQGMVANVLQLTRLNKVFEIYPDIAEARLAFEAQ